MVATLQVVVSEAKNLRKCDAGGQKGVRPPNVMANLRIIEKNSPRKPSSVSTVISPRCMGTCNPQFGEAFTLPFNGVDDQIVYQLEVTLWDQGGTDKSTSNPDNFLGEVLLNIGKLKPWDGIILEQVFELRQGQYTAAPRPSGQLFLKLKYQSEAVPARPIGLSLVIYQSWDAWQATLPQFEGQLQRDLAACLGTDLARVEMVGSEPRKQVVEADGAAFAPIVTHVNLLLPSDGAGGDKRPVQMLEAQLLALLKDTSSTLYQLPISMFTREILVHEPFRKSAQQPPQHRAPPAQPPYALPPGPPQPYLAQPPPQGYLPPQQQVYLPPQQQVYLPPQQQAYAPQPPVQSGPPPPIPAHHQPARQKLGAAAPAAAADAQVAAPPPQPKAAAAAAAAEPPLPPGPATPEMQAIRANSQIMSRNLEAMTALLEAVRAN